MRVGIMVTTLETRISKAADWLRESGAASLMRLAREAKRDARQRWNDQPHGPGVKHREADFNRYVAKLNGMADLIAVAFDLTRVEAFKALNIATGTRTIAEDTAIVKSHVYKLGGDETDAEPMQ
jgi:hypothetical protein